MQKKKTEERIREVRAQSAIRRKKKIRTVLFSITLFMLLLGILNVKRFAVKILWKTELFTLREIKIKPASAESLITGLVELEAGKNLLFLNIDELREKILLIQEVEDCRVQKMYPGTIAVELILRKPWMALIKNGNTFFIDRKGKVVYPIKEGFSSFTIAMNISVGTKQVAEEDLWKLDVLSQIEESFNSTNLRKYIKPEIVAFVGENEILIHSEGKRIIIAKDDIRQKFEMLKLVLKKCSENGQNWEYIDMRFEHPVVKHMDEEKDNTTEKPSQ